MNAEDTKKAMKCCMKTFPLCHGCPLKGTCITEQRKPLKKALELIEHYEAEIERLHSEVEEKTETIVFLKDQLVEWSNDFCNLKAKLDTAKSEAIKEFAERLKVEMADSKYKYVTETNYSKTVNAVIDACICATDTLVKEMTEKEKNND